MQDKRRRDDFASTEVGEVKGGRVTQQAFEVADKKDSGIRNSAMPGTRGDERKAVSQSEQETLGKRASPLEPPNRVVPRVNLAYRQETQANTSKHRQHTDRAHTQASKRPSESQRAQTGQRSPAY